MRVLALMMDHMRDALQNKKVSDALIAQNMTMLSPNGKKNASTVYSITMLAYTFCALELS